MASKMPTAKDINESVITISEAENIIDKNHFSCQFCEAKVGFVNGFTREVGEKIISVSPYFRLKTNNKHGSECKYNLAGKVKIIASESEVNVLAKTDSGKFELRLLAVKKAIYELKELEKEKKKGSNEAQTETKEKEYVKSGRKLRSYINSALRVLKVRSICEENTEIENLLELVFDDIRLPWKDFYYEDKDFFRCYSNIRKATVTVPLAIVGVVKSTKIVEGKNGKFLVVNLAGPYRETGEENVLDAANVSVWSPDLELFNHYKVNDELLAFGIWNTSDINTKINTSSKSSIKKFNNHDLKLWPISKSQLYKIN